MLFVKQNNYFLLLSSIFNSLCFKLKNVVMVSNNFLSKISIAGLILITACTADDDPPIDFTAPSLGVTEITTAVDASTAAVNLETVTVNRFGIEQTFDISDLSNIEVLTYSSSTLPFEVTILGTPTPEGTVPTPPSVDFRAEMVEDAAINSNVNNPSVELGMDFEFSTAIINGPGPDLIIFELGPPVGAPVPGGFLSVGGDPFEISGVGTAASNTAIFGPDDYVQIGEDGLASNMAFYTNVAVTPGVGPDPADPLKTLTELESVDLNLLAVTGLNLYAIAVDLSDLGFADGEVVSELNLRSSGTSFGVDPALILGLPIFE